MHDKIVLLGPIMKYLIVGILKPEAELALFSYIDAISSLWCHKLVKSEIKDLVSRVKEALRGMEIHFPAWDLDINRHNVKHIAEYLCKTGPLWAITMFPFERLWGRLIRWMHQKRDPEKTMLRCYIAMRSAMNCQSVMDTSNREPEGEEEDHEGE